jgi:hypothetical protein
MRKATKNGGRQASRLEELAKSSGISLGLLRKQVRLGMLRVKRIGRRIVVADYEWQRFLREE